MCRDCPSSTLSFATPPPWSLREIGNVRPSFGSFDLHLQCPLSKLNPKGWAQYVSPPNPPTQPPHPSLGGYQDLPKCHFFVQQILRKVSNLSF